MKQKPDNDPTIDVGRTPPAMSVEDAGILGDVASALFGKKSEPIKLQRYELDIVLGQGGLGTVFRARDPKLDRDVAIKLLRPGGGSSTAGEGDKAEAEAQGRLVREAKALAAVSHPNIVQVYDVGRFALDELGPGVGRLEIGDRGVFIVMELIDGRTVDAWIREEDPTVDEVIRVFSEAGRGLHAAHNLGIVHRDFKLSNVMIGTDGRARVLDFGLTHVVAGAPSTEPPSVSGALGAEPSGSLTRTGVVMGTPRYMSPEQHAGEETGPATDQYSFCVALYVALFGRAPFPQSEVRALATAKSDEDFEMPIEPPVPRRVRSAIAKGLSAKPRERFGDMGAIVQALEGQRRRSPVGLAVAGSAVLAGVAIAVTLAGAPRSSERVTTALSDVVAAAGVGTDDRPRPDDPQMAATVESIRDDLDKAMKIFQAGKYEEAKAALNVSLEQSESLGYAPVIADTLHRLGATEHALRDYPKAAGHWVRAVELAEAEGYDRMVAEAGTRALEVFAQFPSAGPAGASERYERLAAAAIERSGLGPAMKAEFGFRRAKAALYQNRYADAVAAVDEAIAAHARLDNPPADAGVAYQLARIEALRYAGRHREAFESYEALHPTIEQVWPGDHPNARAIRRMRPNLLDKLGRHAEAEKEYRASLAQEEAADPGGLEAVVQKSELANNLALQGKGDEAAKLLTEARQAYIAKLGPDDLQVAIASLNLGTALQAAGRMKDARREMERALVLIEELQPGSALSGLALSALAALRLEVGDLDGAEQTAERARTVLAKAVGEGSPQHAVTLETLAMVALERGAPSDAERLARQVIAVREAQGGPETTALGPALRTLGQAQAAAGRNDAAIDSLRRAVAVQTTYRGKKGESQFELAKVLAAAGRDEEARAAGAGACESLAEGGARFGEALAECRGWLKKR